MSKFKNPSPYSQLFIGLAILEIWKFFSSDSAYISFTVNKRIGYLECVFTSSFVNAIGKLVETSTSQTHEGSKGPKLRHIDNAKRKKTEAVLSFVLSILEGEETPLACKSKIFSPIFLVHK